MQKGGRKRKKKCVCVCIADFLALSSLPSKGGLGLGKGHGMATQALACACACIVSIQLFYIFFLYFSARSLFIAGGCLASSVSLLCRYYVHMYTCTHCTVVAFIRLFGWLAYLGFSRRCDDHGWDWMRWGWGWVIEFELNA